MDSFELADHLRSGLLPTIGMDSLAGGDHFDLVLHACRCPKCGVTLVDDLPSFVAECPTPDYFKNEISSLLLFHHCGFVTTTFFGDAATSSLGGPQSPAKFHQDMQGLERMVGGKAVVLFGVYPKSQWPLCCLAPFNGYRTYLQMVFNMAGWFYDHGHIPLAFYVTKRTHDIMQDGRADSASARLCSTHQLLESKLSVCSDGYTEGRSTQFHSGAAVSQVEWSHVSTSVFVKKSWDAYNVGLVNRLSVVAGAGDASVLAWVSASDFIQYELRASSNIEKRRLASLAGPIASRCVSAFARTQPGADDCLRLVTICPDAVPPGEATDATRFPLSIAQPERVLPDIPSPSLWKPVV